MGESVRDALAQIGLPRGDLNELPDSAAAAHGIRSVLLADVGALTAFAALRERGDLPPDMHGRDSDSICSPARVSSPRPRS